MQPIGERRRPDESIFFEGYELHVDLDVLPEHVPEVVYLDDTSVIATYRNTDGQECGQNFKVRHRMYPGDQLLEITAKDAWTRDYNDRGRWVAEGHGARTAYYTIQPGDILILHDSSESDDDVNLVPADEPLPQRTDLKDWRPLGIITTEGKLVTWHGTTSNARWLVDLCIASWVVRPDAGVVSDIDCTNLRNANRRSSLKAAVEGDLATSAYLKWFFDEFAGVDFRPVQEPSETWGPLSQRF